MLTKIMGIVAIGLFLFPVGNATNMHDAHDGEAEENLCTNKRMDLTREVDLWDRVKKGNATASGTIPTEYACSTCPAFNHLPENFPIIPLTKKIALRLKEQSEVNFTFEPEGKKTVDNPFGGIVVFEVPRPSGGRYRVSLNSRLWVDVIAAGGIIPSVDYAGQHQCATIVKSVEFQLDPGRYGLQISSATTSDIELMITKVRE